MAAGENQHSSQHTALETRRSVQPLMDEETNPLANKIATVAVIGLGAALIEAELIPGILIGAAAMLMPDMFPKLGRALRPFVKGAVRAGYAVADRTRETVAEANEQLQDIVAEVKAENGSGSSGPNGQA